MTTHNNPNKSITALKEEHILSFWEENNIFKKSLEKDSPKGEFVFYDGPPFATGLPHYGHLLPGTVKDIIPRFKTMQGYHVDRKWGWDCHGLPIENLIEKELGLETKKDIEEYGIEKFNEAARASVLRYEEEWKQYVPRSGRWVDMENPYMSMNSSYMETGWWMFHQLHTKGLTSEGFKAMHLCPRCETTLANFEVNQGYEDVTDISITAKFELIDEPGTYLLAWTTTPWTLPGNVALAVGKEISYVKFKPSDSNETYIVAKDRLGDVFNHLEGLSQIAGELKIIKGSKLVGKKYQPVFDYYQKQEDLENQENGWQVYPADFVTTDEGTGVVHIAPAFGSDDLELGKQHTLPFVQHIFKNGTFKDDFATTTEGTSFQGMMVKKKDDLMSTDIEIIKVLAHRGVLFSKKKLVHSYPHCWRCGTPLLNYATTSWYVNVPEIKDQLIKNNNSVNWVPEHIGEGRFGKWLEGAREWALSRSRFWGTPLPVWKNEDESETFVASSIADVLNHVQSSGNSYFGLRHGQSESNVSGIINAKLETLNPLTELGREQGKEEAHKLPKDIDYVFVSPLQRTQETAQIIKNELGLSDKQIIVDERLRERSAGEDWEGKLWHDAHTQEEVQHLKDFWSYQLCDTAESISDVYKRTMEFMFDIESRYQHKKIVIVSHGGILKTIQFAIAHTGDITKAHNFYNQQGIPANASLLELHFKPFPHNRHYILDLHRPYIDEIKVISKNGEVMKRIEDVFDVWYDSGSMPYAQVHYPFENNEGFLEKRFPADFIAESIDQTRGWFYLLLVLGTALFDKSPFKNVVVSGMLLAEDGKKMSKSLRNYPDMNIMLDSAGADALRLFLINSPAIKGEEYLFSEKGVQEASSKVMGRLRNILSLYNTYKNEVAHTEVHDSRNILDQWMIARLSELHTGVTESLESYELDKSTRYIFDFVDDLSTWYVRRSRDRYKGDDQSDKVNALGTTLFVLKETAKIIAPFVPFVAEELWQELKHEKNQESVHLEQWSEGYTKNDESIQKMMLCRNIISEGLQLRSIAGIKVRQPLHSFTSEILPESGSGYDELIKDELNVKNLIKGITMEIDTTITPELQAEGMARELLRSIQNLRKEKSLEPHERIQIIIHTDEEGKSIVNTFNDEIRRVANIDGITFAQTEGTEYQVEHLRFIVSFE